MRHTGWVILDWSSDPLAAGLACYCATQFFEAHEHWESAWLTMQEPEKSLLQSLVQVTAAFHHLQADNRTGAISLLRRALKRLSQYPAEFGGIDVASLRTDIEECLQAIESAPVTRLPAYPRIRPVDARLES